MNIDGLGAAHRCGPPDLASIGSDGSFIYPCEAGPCGSIRLKNLRDGIEDWGACNSSLCNFPARSLKRSWCTELFDRLTASEREPLLRKLIRNGTDWTDDVLLLERARRAAAKLVVNRAKPARGQERLA